MMPPWFRKILKALFVIASVLFLLLFLFVIFVLYLPVRSNMSRVQRDADSGHVGTQLVLGTWYLNGNSELSAFGLLRQDDKKAVLYLGKAARAGETHAYFPYAQALERDGQREAAAVWYKKAVDDSKAKQDAESKKRSVRSSERE